MDPTSASQYQNLHYTFQNLALSPPPPPPSEMPPLPLPVPPQTTTTAQDGYYADEYDGHTPPPNGGQQQHQQQQMHHQQQAQQQGHPQQQGQQGPYYDQGQVRAADLRSVGRAGWGGAVNGGNAMSTGSRGKGQRAGLPSQWLQDPSLQQHQHLHHPGQQPQQQGGGYPNGPSGPQGYQQGGNGYGYDRTTSPNPSQQLSTHSISPPPSAGSQLYAPQPTNGAHYQQQPQGQQQQHLYGSSPPLHQLPSPTMQHAANGGGGNGQKYGFPPSGGASANGLGNNQGGMGPGGVGSGAGGAWIGGMAGGLGSGVGCATGPFSMGPGVGGGLEDDVIPTAIVIKNINFNLQKEDLLRTIESLGAPLPYAFNYHMDQGVFRGLAFANFRSAHEADAVVAALNGYDVGGRKLRVEYKKVLQAGEKERIEREKALRRMRSIQQPPVQPLPPPQSMMLNGGAGAGGLVQPMGGMQLNGLGGGMADSYPDIQPVSLGLGLGGSVPPPPQQQAPQQQQPALGRDGSTSSQGTNPGIPIVQVNNGSAQREVFDGSDIGGHSKSTELDLNDPTTLDIYSRVLVFKEDRMRDELAFSRTLSASQRRVVHLVAQKLGVFHYSVGEGDERYAVVTRSEGRGGDRALRHQASRPVLSQQPGPQSASNLYAASPSLRNKSSMPDLSHLHGPAVGRDSQRAILSQRSTMNLRDGYATVSQVGAGARRSQTNPTGAFQDQQQQPQQGQQSHLLQPPGPYSGANKGSESTDSLPSTEGSPTLNGIVSASPAANSPGSLLRQPRGPPAVENRGFGTRRLAPGSAGAAAAARMSTPAETTLPKDESFATSHEPLDLF